MRIIFWSVLLITSVITNAQSDYEKELQTHRAEINEEFADSTKTQLSPEGLAEFQGLDFFDANTNYKVKAKFKRIKNGKVQGFATSTTRIAKYRPYGKLIFKIDGKKCKLTVYEPAEPNPEYPDHLFLPFKDLTNGDSTYGGGRYLDLSKKDMASEVTLDFNYCYNPYCAYSDRYSCPVPPDCNHLRVGIKAGVKAYVNKWPLKGH